MNAKKITRRAITVGDFEFLLEVYASTRSEEMAGMPWTDDQKRGYLKMQLEAQHAYYAETYPGAAMELLMVDGNQAGRLYVDRSADELHIIDIALLPAFRGYGIGTSLLREVLDEGQRVGLPVTIYVEKTNPALRLYQRLGFETIDQDEVYYLMQKSGGM